MNLPVILAMRMEGPNAKTWHKTVNLSTLYNSKNSELANKTKGKSAHKLHTNTNKNKMVINPSFLPFYVQSKLEIDF